MTAKRTTAIGIAILSTMMLVHCKSKPTKAEAPVKLMVLVYAGGAV